MPKTEKDFIPKAVQAQADKAVATQKQVSGQEPNNPPAAPVTETPDPETPPAEPAVTETPPATPDKTPVKKKTVKKAPGQDEDWEHKYSVLQGMYNRDTDELKRSLEDTRSRLEMTERLVAKLEDLSTRAPAPAEPASAAPTPAALVDKAMFSGYGAEMDELIDAINDLVTRVTNLEQRPVQAAPDSSLVERVDRMEKTQEMSAKDKFYAVLNKALPDWGQQNTDPKFKQWLQGVDEVSQVQRMVLIQHAMRSWNAAQVLAIFQQYRKGSEEYKAPIDTVDEDTLDLNAEVMPETTGGAEGPDKGKPPVTYKTKEEFEKAKDDFVHKRITEEEFDKIANSYQASLRAAKS